MALKRNFRNSRPRRHFLCTVAINTTLLIALIGASTVSYASSGQTSQVFTQELSHALSGRLASNDTVVTAPAMVLPSRPVVLNKREVASKYNSYFRWMNSPYYTTFMEHQPEPAFLA